MEKQELQAVESWSHTPVLQLASSRGNTQKGTEIPIKKDGPKPGPSSQDYAEK